MQTKDLVSTLKRFDAYPKTLEDFRIKTFGGGAVTVISGLLMFILFVSELSFYLSTEVTPELYVDTSRGQKLRINLDVLFPKLPCVYLSIDAMDVSGEQQIDVMHSILKRRMDVDGNPIDENAEKGDLGDKSHEAKEILKLDENRCESCYGAETSDQMCCNTCEDVREAYRKKGWALSEVDNIKQCTREGWKDKLETQRNEGCLVTGHLEVNKVAGNFHFAPGKSFQQHHVHVAILRLNSGGNIIKLNMHDLQPFGSTQFNLTHHIRHLSFGNEYPGITHPLDGTAVAAEETGIMYQYFVKIVPTVYRKLNGEVVNTNQFSVTKHKRVVRQVTGEHGLPGVFVLYEFSPMVVQYTENRRSFMHFLTGLCAIVGGIFTVAGLIDSMIYHSSRALQKKIDLGKAT
ncbi:endoplasmic reticulum-Golgi intermediate compartment protein 3-like isoform X1 [Acropora millepora]|uniref:endoplasmic reticulum-Golgi intermediate compartment protein 3-like isoform X1 n=1 Tax=Acropora millepora TaxID=45264 RepID=UPI001CF19793|nr:endoplasmic reticulum-Golgi intermediate compartment protein 3-like isoform X1 [Acropora millepora]